MKTFFNLLLPDMTSDKNNKKQKRKVTIPFNGLNKLMVDKYMFS